MLPYWLVHRVLTLPLVEGDVNSSLQNLATYMQTFLLGALTLCLCWGGYLWMTSSENPTRRAQAYTYLFGAALGAMVVLLAGTIAGAIKGSIA